MSILMGLKPGTVEKLKHTLLYLRLTPKMRNQVMQKVLWRLKKNAKKCEPSTIARGQNLDT